MSQYTTDDLLKLIAEAYARGEPLKLPEGADLSRIDLGQGTIQKKLADWRDAHAAPEDYPPWCSPDTGGVNLAKAILNKANLREAQLQGAFLMFAQLQEAYLIGAHLHGAILGEAQLQGAKLQGAKLQEANLLGAKLLGANLAEAQLQGAILAEAQLQGAHLWRARLQRAYLGRAQLQGADLEWAQLEGAFLARAEWDEKTRLEDADWGNRILGDEREGDFAGAEAAYRRLKRWYANNGQYDLAGEFFYREKEARRKGCGKGTGFKAAEVGEALRRSLWPPPFLWKGRPAGLGTACGWLGYSLWPQRPLGWVGLGLYRVLCGYGERPLRALGWLLGLVLLPALAYSLGGVFTDAGPAPLVDMEALGHWVFRALTDGSFWRALYFSAVSSFALGYGGWVHVSSAWAKGLGVGQTFLGTLLLALFLVTFIRKMSPR